jgi:hypothetical protein
MARRSSQAAGIASIPTAAPAPASDTGGAGPRQWWQWLLLYPTLGIALLTAVPEWMKLAEAWKSNISADQLSQAEKQKELWEKNLKCTTTPMQFFENTNKVKVDATVCESGDVFVRVFAPGDKNAYYWVDVDGLLQTASYPGLISSAQAASLPNSAQAASFPNIVKVQASQTSFVMCQRFVDNRNLLRVLNVEGQCFDEVVDTYTGQVTSRNPSTCRDSC